jgi:hypothetical protein
MWHETISRLDSFTDDAEFERLAADILIRAGFADIIPRGPSMQDGGLDAIKAYFPEDEVFQFSVQRTWRQKITNTVSKLTKSERRAIRKGGALVFVTNQSVPPTANDKLSRQVWVQYLVRLTILDREWLRMQLDLHQDIRARYLQIPPSRNFRPISASPDTFIAFLALPDFMRHLFTLAALRRAPHKAFLQCYFDSRITPVIQNPTISLTRELLPLDRSRSSAAQRIKIRVGKRTQTCYPIVEQGPDFPSLPRFFGSEGHLLTDLENCVPVRGGFLAIPQNRLNSLTTTLSFVSLYCGSQLKRLQFQATSRLEVDSVWADAVCWKIMIQLWGLMGNVWAEALLTEPTPQDLLHSVEMSWTDRSLERMLPFMLMRVNSRALKVITNQADNELFERLGLALGDMRVPIRIRRMVRNEAKARNIDELTYKQLNYWAENFPCQFDPGAKNRF